MVNEKIMPEDNAIASVLVEQNIIMSDFLEREVIIDSYLPTNIMQPDRMSLLLINDGQDLPKMPFDEMLGKLISTNAIEPMMCVGIHCGPERKMEYGTSFSADYKGRGIKAGRYNRFILDELLPFLRRTYFMPSFKEKSFAGFSLGALSAMDIVWNNAREFSKVGIFSGSLWWRRKGYADGYNDETDRIMHMLVRKGQMSPWLKFFFQCGVLDEENDRNNNGIIDSIDDTLDMILELKSKGYTNEHIKYLELQDGKHDVETWGRAFPDFLKWGWGTRPA